MPDHKYEDSDKNYQVYKKYLQLQNDFIHEI
jgi:hypothetical protein